MTDKTDIAALREAAIKSTGGDWCTDSQHSVIADAGLNANYYVAACSGPECMANAKFIALANPATILTLLDQLEAERRKYAAENLLRKASDKAFNEQFERAEAAEKERDELLTRKDIVASCLLIGAQQKEIAQLRAKLVNPVVLPKLSVGEVMHRSGFDRQYAEGWVSANDNSIHEIRTAGFLVKEE
ncbi:ead/Ea22-like family protein [Ewingella sp. S1.OA.A_B6]